MPIINQIVKGGGTTPTGTINILQNGIVDVTDFASADVQVPTTAPASYRAFQKNASGQLVNSTSAPWVPLPAGTTDISDYCLYSAYRFTPANVLSGAIDLSSLTTISGTGACNTMFQNCTGITSVDLSSLTTISGINGMSSCFSGCSGLTSIDLSGLTAVSGSAACREMFQNCPGITSINLSSLTTLSGANACNTMFYGCTGITSINLSSLTTISGTAACSTMFAGCAGITSIDLSGLTAASGSSACFYMFQNCTGITSVDLSGLTTLSGNTACSYMFANCTSLATVYIGGTTAIDFGARTNQFDNMFQGCTQNIDVYAPAANQTQIEAFSGYPNFGATGTVTWHWRS